MPLDKYAALSRGKMNAVIDLTGVPLTQHQPSQYTTYKIAVARDTSFDAITIITLLQTFGSLIAQQRVRVRLGIEAHKDEVCWTISLLGTERDVPVHHLLPYIQTHFPTATLTKNPIRPSQFPIHRRWALYQFPPTDWHTIFANQPDNVSDPLAQIVSVLESLQAGEAVRIEFYLLNFSYIREQEITDLLFETAHQAGYGIQTRTPYNALGMLYELGRISYQFYQLLTTLIPRYSEREQYAYLDKLTQPHFDVRLCMLFDTPHRHRLSVFDNINTAVQFWSRRKPTFLQRLANQRDRAGLRLQSYEQWVLHHPMIQFALARASDSDGTAYPRLAEDVRIRLTAEELSTLWHLPHEDIASQKIRWTVLIPDELLMVRSNTSVIGYVDDKPIGISRVDRQYPIIITGAPGMGKSNLAHNIAIFDISMNDSCVVIVDPQGGWISRILQQLTPDQMSRVVLMDLGDTTNPPPLNFLRNISAVDEQETFESVMWIFRSIYGNRWDEQSMVRLEATTHNLISLLLADPESTILDMIELLDNNILRNNLLDKLGTKRSARLTRRFWKRLEDSSRGVRSSFTASAVARIAGVTRYAHTQRMMGHPHGLNYQQLIEDKKIVLIDASSPSITSSRAMLGALIFSQFYLACRSLGANINRSSGQMRPPRCHLFVDDADLFISSAFPEIFSKARQFGLAPVLITQALSYFEDHIEEGISKSRGTSIVFGTDEYYEAREAVTRLNKYEPEDVLALGKGEAIVRTRYQGKNLDPVTFKTVVKTDNMRTSQQTVVLRKNLKETMNVYTHDGKTITGLWGADQIDEWLDARETSGLYTQAQHFIKQNQERTTDSSVSDDPKGLW